MPSNGKSASDTQTKMEGGMATFWERMQVLEKRLGAVERNEEAQVKRAEGDTEAEPPRKAAVKLTGMAAPKASATPKEDAGIAAPL